MGIGVPDKHGTLAIESHRTNLLENDIGDRLLQPEARSRLQPISSAVAAARPGLVSSRQNQTATVPERPRTGVSSGPFSVLSGSPG